MAEPTTASLPVYQTIVERDVFIPARDGVKLAVDIYRPDGPGKFPALLAMSPYGKDTQMFDTPPQPFGKSIFEASIECGDACFYAQRGYVYVIADLRGIGHSEGIYEGLFSHYEGEDGCDIVEWLAQQPWCDGNVGTAGICYFSSMQLHVAAEQPPHLKCIAPWEIFGDDLYNHGQYEGGVFNIFLYGLYTGTYPARCGYAPNDVRSAMEMNTPPEELKKIVEEAMADPDLKQYPYLLHLLQYPKKNPILFDFMLHKLDGPYYRERSVSERLDQIKVPCYVGGPLLQLLLAAADERVQQGGRAQEDVPVHRHGHPSMAGKPRRAAALVRLLAQGHRDRHHGRAAHPLPHHGHGTVAGRPDLAAREHCSGPTSTSRALRDWAPSPIPGTRSPTRSCNSPCTSPRSGTA